MAMGLVAGFQAIAVAYQAILRKFDGLKLNPTFALGTWLGFKKHDDKAMVMPHQVF
jgi:hypothetical protein